MSHARETTLTSSVIYLSALTSKVYLLVNPFFESYMLPIFFSGLLSYLVGIKRRTRRCVTYKRENSHLLRYVLNSPKAKILCRRLLPYCLRSFDNIW